MEFAIQSVDIGDIRRISNYIFHYSLWVIVAFPNVNEIESFKHLRLRMKKR
jgi:hypothetical protein